MHACINQLTGTFILASILGSFVANHRGENVDKVGDGTKVEIQIKSLEIQRPLKNV